MRTMEHKVKFRFIPEIGDITFFIPANSLFLTMILAVAENGRG